MKILIGLLLSLTSCNSEVKLTESDSGLSKAAKSIKDPSIIYSASYVRLSYPNGDVNPKTGVCTDVVIRAYRKLGIDLQKLVHEDMLKNFSDYPNKWGLARPNSNIDHRRVPNLMKFFSKYGKSLVITNNPKDYKPGEVIAWELNPGVLHIGITVNELSGNTYKVIHNIGGGQVIEDVLFSYKIIGHYKY